ncbi:hypothetical protein [Gilvimarinus sp. DA14]|uniref:hypothetical protein n=1 Tax=Gilvimarinus sp. DA14 TaxID=2956798 RepID=UPI0020B63AC2|nr:hypothetical protein [Gilvimarinus sp. DA14]UTF60531.1 hypothetical protein NHM04_01670 [Gilvimarinus sp. DA14]
MQLRKFLFVFCSALCALLGCEPNAGARVYSADNLQKAAPAASTSLEKKHAPEHKTLGKPSLNAHLSESEFTLPLNEFTDIALEVLLPKSQANVKLSINHGSEIELSGSSVHELWVSDAVVAVDLRLRALSAGRHLLHVLLEMPESGGLSRQSFTLVLNVGEAVSPRQFKSHTEAKKVILPAQESVY